jgi:molybdopterin converting factor small subunit
VKIRVRLYSQLRDLAGGSELELEMPDDDRIRVNDLLEKLYQEKPALRSRDRGILVGAGVEFVDRNYVLKAGEEISVMPPVQGG